MRLEGPGSHGPTSDHSGIVHIVAAPSTFAVLLSVALACTPQAIGDPTPTPSVGDAPESPIPAPDPEKLVHDFVALVDRGCACADSDCFSRIEAERRSFSDRHRGAAFTREQGERIDAEEQRIRACRAPKERTSRVAEDGGELEDSGEREEIREFIRRRMSVLHVCLNEGRRARSDLAGKIAYVVTASATGAVTNVAITLDTLQDESVKRCTVAAIEGWRFPASPGAEGSTDISFSVVFSGP